MASEQNGTAGLAEVLTEATLQQRAYGKSYFRGVSCFERGAVENLSDFGGRLVARVRGAELYRVELWSENGLSHSCSCPVGADGLFCKHCVAAGLEWLARRSEAEPLDEPGERVERVEVTRDEVREYLSRQSNEALVGLLMRHAQADLEFAELLRARVATSRPGGPGPSFLRQMITNATRVHGDLYGHVLDSYVEEVRTALEPVWALLDAGHGAEALALAEHALKRLEKAERQAAEYNDRGLSGLLTEVEKLHLAACLRARPDPRALACRLYNAARSSNSGLFADAARTYAEVLGEPGLAEYRRLVEAEWRQLPAPGPTRPEPARARLIRMLESLARTSGDTEEVARAMAHDLSCPERYLEVARLYQQAGDADQALEWAEKGAKAFPDRPDSQLREFLFDEHLRRGRQKDAMNLAWAEFTDWPSGERYAVLKTRAEKVGQVPTWREEALEFLRERAAREGKTQRQQPPDWGWGHDQTTGALVEILLAEGEDDAAWQEAAGAELEAGEWLKLADARADRYPADAVAVYQRYVEYLMDGRYGKRYEEAVRYLVKAARLAARAGQYPQFERYLADFRARYKRKWSLMSLLDSAEWPRPTADR